MLLLAWNGSQKQESVSLGMIIPIATKMNLESDSAQEDSHMILLVETQLPINQTMETNTSKQWDTFWCSNKEMINCSRTQYFKLCPF